MIEAFRMILVEAMKPYLLAEAQSQYWMLGELLRDSDSYKLCPGLIVTSLSIMRSLAIGHA